MPQKQVAIVGHNNTRAAVNGQEQLMVHDNNLDTIKTPHLISTSTTGTIAGQPHSVSVYNSGAAAGTLTINGDPAVSIPAGVTINMDAGGNNNRFTTGTIVYNATGTTFLISYVS
jgi:hypothetical protein